MGNSNHVFSVILNLISESLVLKKLFRMAVELKPECGSKNETGAFYNIGG